MAAATNTIKEEDVKTRRYCRKCKREILMAPVKFGDSPKGLTEYGTICPVCGTRSIWNLTRGLAISKFGFFALGIYYIIGIILALIYIQTLFANLQSIIVTWFILPFILLFLLWIFWTDWKRTQKKMDYADRNYEKNEKQVSK